MNFKIDFLLIIILFAPFIYAQLLDDWRKFPGLPKTRAKLRTKVKIGSNDQFEIQNSIGEIDRRIDEFEPKMIQIQKSLDVLLKLHGMMEESLRMYKPCNNMGININNKLEEMKNDLINEMNKKNREHNRLSETKWEQVKQDIVATVDTKFKNTIQAMDNLSTKVEFIDDRLQNITDNCGKIQQSSETEKLEPSETKKLEPSEMKTPEPSEMKKPKLVLPDVPKHPKNCKEILERGNVKSGYYTIEPTGSPEYFEVLCDMDTQGGGWTYFMRRFDGSQDFNLNWTDYKNGFGDLAGEFWLGLEHLYELTGSKPTELLFVLTDWEGQTAYANFNKFSIGNESERYAIKVLNGYSGEAGRSFFFHLNKKFSTLDKQDEHGYCVERHHGPWWYGPGCFVVKLTGEYFEPGEQLYSNGIHYHGFHEYDYSLKEVAMMVRP